MSSYIQEPPDSTGKKLRTWEETIGADTVQNQTVDLRTGECYIAAVNNVVPAASKCFLAILNGSGSGKTIIIHTCLYWNNQITSVTGGEMTIRYVRITALSGGTAITPVKINTANANVPSQVVIQTNPTTSTEDTAPAEYMSHKLSSDEIVTAIGNATGTPVLLLSYLHTNLNPALESHQRIKLPEGKGIAIKQGSEAVTAGAISALIVFEVI